jgi:membrane protein DedA with SNARE-associated domain
MESLETFIQNWGYWGLLLGTFLEGEAILLIAGFMAYAPAGETPVLSLPLVMLIAALGGTFGDQFYFYLGRYHRDWLFRKFPGIPKKAAKIYEWIERYPDLLIIVCRFIYGFRITTPVVLGTSRLSALRFSIFNVVGAIIWSVTVSLAGYYLGNVVEKFIGDLHKIQHYIIGAIVFIAIGLFVVHTIRGKKKPSSTKSDDGTTPP